MVIQPESIALLVSQFLVKLSKGTFDIPIVILNNIVGFRDAFKTQVKIIRIRCFSPIFILSQAVTLNREQSIRDLDQLKYLDGCQREEAYSDIV